MDSLECMNSHLGNYVLLTEKFITTFLPKEQQPLIQRTIFVVDTVMLEAFDSNLVYTLKATCTETTDYRLDMKYKDFIRYTTKVDRSLKRFM
jgi:hypothetical protein